MAIQILLGVIVAVYFALVSAGTRLLVERKHKRKKEFFKALGEGLRIGSIKTIDDVVNIYKGVAGLSSEDLSYRYSLSRQLREFLAGVTSKDKNVIDKALEDEVIRDWTQKLSEFIKKNEALSPYADLPTAERNVLNDISVYIDKSDLESIKRKSLELAGMIQARNDDLNRIRAINKWTIPLSIFGLIFTVFFGIVVLTK